MGVGRPSRGTDRVGKVIDVGGPVHDDIEGLALYQGTSGDYLVISSQGNDSYVVLDAQAPYAVRGAFRIGLNAERGIDGASETDGLEVTSANLGGIWSRGMLVVQDGRKRMPEGRKTTSTCPGRRSPMRSAWTECHRPVTDLSSISSCPLGAGGNDLCKRL